MSSFESKVKFTAQDNGLSSFYDKIKRQSSSLMSEMIRDAQKYSEASKDQLSYLQDQIKAIERRSQLDKQASLVSAQKSFSAESSMATTDLEHGEIEQQYKQTVSGISQEGDEDKLQVQVLKDILDAIKEDTQSGIVLDKTLSEQRANEWRKLSTNEKSEFDPEIGLSRQIESDQFPKQQGMMERLMESTFGQVAAANLVSGGIQELMSSPSTIAEAQSGEQLFSELVSTIPFVGGVGALMQRGYEEQYNVQSSRRELSGRVGRDVSLSPGQESRLQQIGHSLSEAYPMINQFTESLGKLDEKASVDALIESRAKSIPVDQLNQMFLDMRSGTTDMGVAENIKSALELIPALKKDPTQRPEFLELQSQLFKQSLGTVGNVDRTQLLNLIGQFSEIDSEFFSDPRRAGQTISTVDESLRNPTSEFARAQNFRALQQMNPGASYQEMIEMQSRGMNEPKFLQSVLGNLANQGFSGEGLATMLTGDQFGGGGRMNLNPESAGALANYFDQNPQAFSKVKTESDLKAVFEKMGVDLEGAKSLTAPREEDQAAIANAFSKDIVEGTSQAIKEGADELDRTLSAFTTSVVKHFDPGGKIDRILVLLEKIEKFLKNL